MASSLAGQKSVASSHLTPSMSLALLYNFFKKFNSM